MRALLQACHAYACQQACQHEVVSIYTGNICRSPTAEAVFRAVVERAGMQNHFVIDSCGTGGGNPDWYDCHAIIIISCAAVSADCNMPCSFLYLQMHARSPCPLMSSLLDITDVRGNRCKQRLSAGTRTRGGRTTKATPLIRGCWQQLPKEVSVSHPGPVL